MKKRVIATLMAVILSMSSVPFSVWADDIENNAEELEIEIDEPTLEDTIEDETPDEENEIESTESLDNTELSANEEDLILSEAEEPIVETESSEEVITSETDINTDTELFVEGEAQSYTPGENDVSEDDFFNYIEKQSREQSNSGTLRKSKRNAGSRLTGLNGYIYSSLSIYIQKVASGERASTVFEIPVEDLGMEQLFWTASELGVPSIIENDEITEEALDAVASKGVYDIDLIIQSLLADNPYQLYWYDKTAETQAANLNISVFYDEEKEEYVIGFVDSLMFSFPVSGEYAVGEYEFNTEIGQSVQNIIENANNIVAKYAENSDYEKLNGYRQEICDLVSYNQAAADGEVSYGNPWQLIWVFDEDPETNVVCEGYAKAFQYLCDQTSFSGDISCITVTGTMTGGTGEGAHMWNVVRMEDGNNYLVDVTNCDEGSIGSYNLLFLAGGSEGTWTTRYVFYCNAETISYAYDEVTMSVFLQEELQISTQRYALKSDVITQGDLQFEINGNKAKVIGYVGTPIDVIIPEKINGIPVTSIGGAAFDKCESLRSINIPGSVVSIDDGNFLIADNYEYGSFFDCKNLEKVVLHEGLEYIGYLAFRFCEKLKEIELPESVNFVAPLVFSNCKSLTAIRIPQNLHYLSSGMFDACWDLKQVTLHDNIEVLGEGAFNDCKGLEHITLNDGLREIGDACFGTCYSLEEVDIPDSVTYIGEKAFESCISIKRIEIPEGITCIYDKTFAGMDQLIEVNLPSSLDILGNNVFAYSQILHDITFPANVSSIGSHCFEGCNELRRIVFEGALPAVSDDFLYDFIGIIYYTDELSHWRAEDYKDYQGHPVWCANGKEKDIFVAGECSSSVQWELTCDGELIISGDGDMPYYNSPQDLPWFHYLYLITELTVNEGMTSICDYCVMATREMKEVTLPKTLKSIGIYSFAGTRSLTRISLPDRLESIGKKAFENSHIETITIPDSVSNIEEGVFAECQYLKEIVIQENNHYCIENDILYSGDYSVLIACLPFKEGPVILNDGVQKIGDSAFYDCKKITEINLPESTSEIGDFAFLGCESLTKVNLSHIIKMEQAAFQNCSQLQEVVFSDCITTIPYHAFSGCDSVKEITLPQSVKSIQYNAFRSYKPDNETTVLFEGNLPEIDDSFINRKLIVKYPQGLSSWNKCEEHFGEETVFIGYEHTVHIWEEGVVTSAPTCTNSGVKTYHCSICAKTRTEEIPAQGHAWDEMYTVDKEVTCTETGRRSIHCANCSEIKDVEEIPANGHQFGEWIIVESATCEADGCQKRICEACGYTETNNITANGHAWEDYFTIDKPATCTEDGSRSIHCANCDAVKDSEVIPSEGHIFGPWEIIEANSCEAGGSQKHACTVCGMIETMNLDPTGHAWETEYTVDKDATCTQAGSQSVHCANCDAVKDSVVIPALGHAWNEGTISTVPTCTEAGQMVYKCDRCGISRTEEIEAAGHAWNTEYTIDQPASCTEGGIRSIHCANCNERMNVEEIPANGHQFGEWVTIESPDCDSAGCEQRICETCGYTETNGIDPAGHTWETEFTVDIEPTCTTNGSQSIHCALCDAKQNSEVIPALGHAWDEGTVNIASTCTENGEMLFSCTQCGETYTEVIPAAGHQYGAWMPQDEELHVRVCSADANHTEAANHHWDEGVVTKELTLLENGESTYTCADCGMRIEREILPTAADLTGWINELPATAGVSDKETVETVRAAYERMSQAQKALVAADILSRLETAEAQVAAAESAEEKAEADRLAANAVIEKINGLSGTITVEDEEAVNAVRAAYNSLTADQKKLIDAAVLSKLTTAEQKVTKAKQDAGSAKTVSIAGAAVTGIVDKTYTGKAVTQDIVVKLNKVTLKANTDYMVSFRNNTNAGKATITITGKGRYNGTVTKTFTINKAENPMSVKTKTAKVKYAKLSKKKQTIAAKKAFTVGGAQGDVTYKVAKYDKKAKKKIKVSKTGTITIKKGLKKGTYKLKVTVTAAGNSNYLAGSKTVTLKVKIK